MKQSVIVCGASGALGAYVVRAFLAQDWTVHAFVRSKAGTTQEHDQLHVHEVDLSDAERVEAAVGAVENYQAVVQLAGGIEAGLEIPETSPELFERMIDINLRTTFNVLRATTSHLQEVKGSFVAMGSSSALRAEAKKSAYSAAKAAMISLVLTAAEEGRAHGMRAHVVVPGILKTPANLEWAQDGQERAWTEPEDCANTIVALCSPSLSGVNGAIIPLYAGLRL